MELKRAILLRGVTDPADATRLTTVLYRPKHGDLRWENGFVRSGDVLVPLDNVSELRSYTPEVEKPAEDKPIDLKERVHHAVVSVESAVEKPVEPTVEEKPLRRRGRPAKKPATEQS